MPEVSRRQFLQGSVAGAGALGLAAFGFDADAAAKEAGELRIQNATETRSVCPYCAVGCSMIAYTVGGQSRGTPPKLIHIEGDPDSPINAGTLCPKGASTLQLAVNQRRPEHPMYRAAGGTKWERVSWDDAMDKMARWVKDARDHHFTERDDKGNTVNRQTGFAFLGGATISNEEGYLTVKMMRALGTVYIEQQARV
jgi:formate dehydrogenase major subunit